MHHVILRRQRRFGGIPIHEGDAHVLDQRAGIGRVHLQRIVRVPVHAQQVNHHVLGKDTVVRNRLGRTRVSAGRAVCGLGLLLVGRNDQRLQSETAAEGVLGIRTVILVAKMDILNAQLKVANDLAHKIANQGLVLLLVELLFFLGFLLVNCL